MWKRNFRKNKYGNAMAGGSKLEEAVYVLLKQREKDGEISSLQRQQVVVLQGGGQKTRITWRADFSFIKNGEQWYAEAKGYHDEPVWKHKLKMLRYQKIKTEVWAGTYQKPFLMEVIE